MQMCILFVPSLVQTLLSVQSSPMGGNLAVNNTLRGLQELMRNIATGVLLHGPLLGWARCFGDTFWTKTEVVKGELIEYLMPRRDGLTHDSYPWAQHGKDAVEGVRKMLRTMGVWTHHDGAVKDRASPPNPDAHRNANFAKRAQALRASNACIQLEGFAFSIMDDAWLSLSSVSLSILSLEDNNLPHGIEQFFGPLSTDIWSFFMQEKGEFLWAFKRTSPATMSVHKILGKRVSQPQGALSFQICDCKPVKQVTGGLSTYHHDQGESR